MSDASKSAQPQSSDITDGEGVIPSSIQKAIAGIAKGIGIAATELWTIFVRQYVVRGLSEAFTAIVLGAVAFSLKDAIGYWAFIPAGVAMLFAYGAIAYLGNPKYYALTDITKRIQDFKNDGDSSSSKSTSSRW